MTTALILAGLMGFLIGMAVSETLAYRERRKEIEKAEQWLKK